MLYQTATLSQSSDHCHHQYHNHHHHQQRLLHIFPYFCPKFFLFTQRNFQNFLTKIILSISLTSLMLTSLSRPIIYLFHRPLSFSICVKRLPTMRCIRPRLRAATIIHHFHWPLSSFISSRQRLFCRAISIIIIVIIILHVAI